MNYTNSPLAKKSRISPNYSNDRKGLNRITIHHTAGVMTSDAIGNVFASKSRQASCNYGIGNDDGTIILVCEEKYRSWCSSSKTNDGMAITYECSNSKYGEPWPISDAVYASIIALTVDICKRYNITEVFEIQDEIDRLPQKDRGSYANNYVVPEGKILMTQHNYFSATACPGTTIKRKFKEIVKAVNLELKKTEPPKEFTTVYKGVDYAPVFDAKYYYKRYTDLQMAIGPDQQKLFDHFILYGSKEGRQASENFNPYTYRKRYEDLEKTFGDDWQKYYWHYCTQGIKEGRSGI